MQQDDRERSDLGCRSPTFLLLAVAADVGVVAVQRACGHMRPAAVVLGVQRVDGDVDQMEHHIFTHVHISVRILEHSKTE